MKRFWIQYNGIRLLQIVFLVSLGLTFVFLISAGQNFNFISTFINLFIGITIGAIPITELMFYLKKRILYTKGVQALITEDKLKVAWKQKNFLFKEFCLVARIDTQEIQIDTFERDINVIVFKYCFKAKIERKDDFEEAIRAIWTKKLNYKSEFIVKQYKSSEFKKLDNNELS